MTTLTLFSFLSLAVLAVVYFFLITEKLNKVVVAALGAATLILMQVFRSAAHSSQEGALEFLSKNLDILGFILGMMVLVGIVRESGAFEAVAIWLVKLVRGQPVALLVSFGYLTVLMTIFFSNIPTILILTPVLLVLIRELKLPALPYFFTMVTMANLAGAATPISDPTTYYQAKTVGLGFMEVVTNSGVIVLVLTVVTVCYALLLFRKDLAKASVKPEDLALFRPRAAIRNRRMLRLGIPLLAATILLLITKEQIRSATGVTLDNATITIAASTIAMLLFHKSPKDIFRDVIDWEILSFFSGLFIIVGALEFTHVIDALARLLVDLTSGSEAALLGITTLGSASLSVFIDNVPLNITMVGAIQEMERAGLYVYPLWWALNLGTSIGGAGAPISAACNVIAFGQAEREKIHVSFIKYLKLAFPLVLLNAGVTFGILWLRYLR